MDSRRSIRSGLACERGGEVGGEDVSENVGKGEDDDLYLSNHDSSMWDGISSTSCGDNVR